MPPTPLIAATSPTRTWSSRIRKKPLMTSRTSVCAPKPTARPSDAGAGQHRRDVQCRTRSAPSAARRRSSAMVTTLLITEPSVSARLARSSASSEVPRLSSCSKRVDEQAGDADQRVADDDGREERQALFVRPGGELAQVQAGLAAGARSTSRAGKSRTAKISRNAAVLTRRSGPRTSGLVRERASRRSRRSSPRLSRGGRAGRRARRPRKPRRGPPGRTSSQPGRRKRASTLATTYNGSSMRSVSFTDCGRHPAAACPTHAKTASGGASSPSCDGRSSRPQRSAWWPRATDKCRRNLLAIRLPMARYRDAAVMPPGLLQRQAQRGAHARAIGPILELQAAAVRLGDLPAQHQADAGAAGLGGEERHEQVAGIREARTLVLDPQFDRRRRRPGTRCQPTRTLPPVSLTASTALRIRLISSCSSWSASPWIVSRGPAGDLDVVRLLERRRRDRRTRPTSIGASFGGGSFASRA